MSVIIRRLYEVCCLYGCLVYHILSYSFGSIFIIVCMVVCMFLFNFVNYAFLLLCICILIVMYVSFWVFCFIVLFCVLFVCKCVLYYCHRVTTQLQLTNISYQNYAVHFFQLSSVLKFPFFWDVAPHHWWFSSSGFRDSLVASS